MAPSGAPPGLIDDDHMNEYPPYPGDTGHRLMVHFDPVTQTFPRIPSYLILDHEAYTSFSIGFPTSNDPRMTFAWSSDNVEETDLGILKAAGSLEALAAIVGCDTSILRRTIEDWNRSCAGEAENPFGRQPGMGSAVEASAISYSGGAAHRGQYTRRSGPRCLVGAWIGTHYFVRSSEQFFFRLVMILFRSSPLRP